MTNRSMPACTVIPVLAYLDVAAASAWLCAAFGFGERWRAGDHRAQLSIGAHGAMVVVHDPGGHSGTAAGDPGSSTSRHSVMVRVNDVDAHHAQAVAHGSRVMQPPADFPYGERQYSVQDIGGHLWTFSQSIADVAPEDWGGATGADGTAGQSPARE